ncbi:uncharacterized MFS-type transporter C330.07c-like isoform X2 [Selaginella moellendorffii]|uniref:uncharacterized MFS-type transporter C330.07c-like isoform X2 n=1 Tax=Selaginella moellendorffii TaxID=88036 RepID=UPI000D1C77DE|nr:uncharacterized MFS-type transporter C330.07c-like isoform X2 [Selaginella moellendorffii]|eukprot:XP_024533540.1 uncharacterized MFS-type transporter C330.07c-like isoform X2 [Selaginella moellendorffii]
MAGEFQETLDMTLNANALREKQASTVARSVQALEKQASFSNRYGLPELAGINVLNIIICPDDHQVSIQMSHLECVVSPLFVSCLMSYTAFVIFFELGSWETSIPIYSWKKFGLDAFEAGNFIGLIGLGTVFLVATMPALAHKIQDRLWLAAGCFLGLAGIVANYILLGGNSGHMNFPSYAAQWFVVCLGFNTASSITLSLLSKNLGNKSSDRAAIAVQLSNYSGRLLGAIWGTAADLVGDRGCHCCNGGDNCYVEVTYSLKRSSPSLS